MNNIRVLVACEESQRVCIAFRERGFEAYSCDVVDCSGGHPEWHIKDDVLKHLNDGWDLMIAHPDCTRITNSGVRWLNERNLWDDMEKACHFFNTIKSAPIKCKALENPIPHKYARMLIGEYTQIISPHYFGDKESKATCLWLLNLPLLKRTHFIDKSEIKQSIWREPPSTERKRNRSRTFPGIAQAMAQQWGDYILSLKGGL